MAPRWCTQRTSSAWTGVVPIGSAAASLEDVRPPFGPPGTSAAVLDACYEQELPSLHRRPVLEVCDPLKDNLPPSWAVPSCLNDTNAKSGICAGTGCARMINRDFVSLCWCCNRWLHCFLENAH